jgi:hypothetical protein
MLSTSSYGVHRPDDINILADWGFDFIVNYGVKKNEAWDGEVERAHKQKMKYLTRWPEIPALGLNAEKYAFAAYDGRKNTDVGTGRVEGPSHWNKEAEEITAKNIDELVAVGLDGVLISMLTSDRMYPTDWYPFGDKAIQGTRYYWSWDDEAQKQWDEFSGGEPMPEACQCFEGACAEYQRKFYKWYQDGWISKLTRLSDVAIDAGMKHIWTWLIPHTNWTEVNMANGTADCILPIEKWRQHVIKRGAEPMIVVACHFDLENDWPVWFADGDASIRNMCTEPLNWKMIVGAETCYSASTVTKHLDTNSQKAAEMGCSGLFCGTKIALDNPDDKYQAAFLAAKEQFAEKHA